MTRVTVERCPNCASMLTCIGMTRKGSRVLTCLTNLTSQEEGRTTMVPCNPKQLVVVAGSNDWRNRTEIAMSMDRSQR